jgi:hypothetical protein
MLLLMLLRGYLDSGVVISSSRVTLKDTSNWELWLSMIKTIAEQFDVWDLCDPNPTS